MAVLVVGGVKHYVRGAVLVRHVSVRGDHGPIHMGLMLHARIGNPF